MQSATILFTKAQRRMDGARAISNPHEIINGALASDGAQTINDISDSGVGIFVVYQTGIIHFCNDILLTWLGLPSHQVLDRAITTFLPDLPLPRRLINTVAPFNKPMVNGAKQEKLFLYKPDGDQIAVIVQLDKLPLNGEQFLICVINCDHREYPRKRSVEDLMFSAMLSKQAMAITDKSGRFEFVNDTFEAMTGYRQDELIGHCWTDVLPDLSQKSAAPTDLLVHDNPSDQKRISTHRKKDGTVFMLCQSMRFFIDADDQSTHHIFEGRDVSAIVAAHQRLKYLAYYDPLTNLPARTRVLDCLQQTLDEAHYNNRHFAIAIIDVDNFKNINDRLGHAAGDSVLQVVGTRLKSSLGDDDMVGRLSGDEFIAILPQSEQLTSAESVVNGIHAAFSTPFSVGNSYVSVGVSIGLAIYPIHGKDKQSLLEYADAQMYLDKPIDGHHRQSGRRSKRPRRYVEKISTPASDKNKAKPKH